MSKLIKHVVFISLFFPWLSYAIGLGEMTVHSYLNQPFHAEIELLDLGNIPISTIQASLASVEDFEHVGLERTYVLNLLTFKVEKTNGKPVVIVRSVERMSEPYLELLVDLAWREGQIYRAYTILLDPPQYQLATDNKVTGHMVRQATNTGSGFHESGVIDKPVVSHVEHSPQPSEERHQASTYGPTKPNETIWQIAQRYKTPSVQLPQIILAIAGENPDAFINGNLNGLNSGIKLTIPATETIDKVPEALANQEVLEHDKAWASKEPIDHILTPPYIDGKEIKQQPIVIQESIIPVIKFEQSTPDKTPSTLFPQLRSFLSVVEDVAPTSKTDSRSEQQERVKAELNVAKVAIESVRESNAVLSEEVKALQNENKQLRQELAESQNAIKQLQEEIRLLKTRQGVAGQAAMLPPEREQSRFWLWILLLIIAAGGGALYYWWFWVRPKAELSHKKSLLAEEPIAEEPVAKEPVAEEPVTEEPATEEPVTEEPVAEEPVAEEPVAEEPVTEEPVAEEPVAEEPVAEEPVAEEPVAEEPVAEEPVAEEPVAEEPEVDVLTQEKQKPPPTEPDDEYLIEFEPVVPTPVEANKTKKKKKASENDENSLDFHIEPEEPAESKTVEERVEDKLDITDVGEGSAVLESQEEAKKTIANEEKPVRSKQALDTLLDLAETYISMEDYEAAKQSLEEVIEYGSDAQKERAQNLLGNLDE